MKNLQRIVPHIPSENIKETIKFMVDTFDFNSLIHNESYAELYSGEQSLGILQSQKKPNQQSIYLYVNDIDALWPEIKNKLDKVKIKAPFNTDYGMREIHLVIPASNTLLFIGSSLDI